MQNREIKSFFKTKNIRDAKHLANVRKYPCFCCATKADHAHHLLTTGSHGMALKAGDDETIPLCHVCHRALHDYKGGERAFLKACGRSWESTVTYAKTLYKHSKNKTHPGPAGVGSILDW